MEYVIAVEHYILFIKYLRLFPDDTVQLSHQRRKTNIAERVAFRPVYAMCMEAEQMPGTIWMVRWWDQDAVCELEDYTRRRCN